MNLRLLATPLLAAGLLLSTLGCSKKEEAAPAATGSYVLSGKTINCTVRAVVQLMVLPNSLSAPTRNLLTVELITVPEPASGPEKLELFFYKEVTQSPKTYLLSDFYLFNAATPNGIAYESTSITLKEDSGLYSGKFEASRTGPPLPAPAITAGSFSNARPY